MDAKPLFGTSAAFGKQNKRHKKPETLFKRMKANKQIRGISAGGSVRWMISRRWLKSQNTCMRCGRFMPKTGMCKCIGSTEH